ncbi:UvrABC system protein A [Kitasatospora phosalacinea]|uniref:UvrABC system protein A n=1 Tax=Kitasatospora phosalacinea TaxID=2065 RepID=A0A9W6V3J7_9ACTN|nr:excinuclease ABC subunit UvrA [Kitasatospora phosalacinea]GLW74434.1 UvrABC system protein A [Kitasatospora phosalacinea]
MTQGTIDVVGARTHNLQNVSVAVPKGKIVAFTGVSGSGKTSLLMDTIHAEAQLRYLEGMSPFVRQFMTPRDRPQVDRVDGLPPTLAVDQRSPNRSPGSTVATITAADDYLGLLFASLPPLGPDWDGSISRVLKPSQFSPRNPDGCCSVCSGSGQHAAAEPALLIARPELPLLDGASAWFADAREPDRALLAELARLHGADLNGPWADQPAGFQRAVLHGTGAAMVNVVYDTTMKKSGTTINVRNHRQWPGVIAEVERLHAAAPTPAAKERYSPYIRSQVCAECQGTGLGLIARTVTLGGSRLGEVLASPISEAVLWAERLSGELGPTQREAAQAVLPGLLARLRLMQRLGLGHIGLSRSAPTLSGGELQRARVAAQLCTALSGVAFVLDEPSAGLHPADKQQLRLLLEELRAAENTILMIEHDPELIKCADWVIDIGPRAGRNGGQLVAEGSPQVVAGVARSLTGRYLADHGHRVHRTPRALRADRRLVLTDVSVKTVRAERVSVPQGALTCLTGVSGSGKSTLLIDGFAQAVQARLDGKRPSGVGAVSWDADLDWVSIVDQEPIGRTPRSNPATYTKAFNLIRGLYAGTDAARRRGLTASDFSFNSAGGRCEVCAGHGVRQVDMHFLPDVWVTCEACEGRRFEPQVLGVTWRSRAIDEVLDLTVDEAVDFFDLPALQAILRDLVRVGLGYLRLGQSATVLSGGEAQRLKLAAALSRTGKRPGLAVLDEPFTGLHPADVQVLVEALDSLVARGSTVILAEHDLHVAGAADWIVDLGPGAGDKGGRILHAGTPGDLRESGSGPTADYLRSISSLISVGSPVG